MNARPSRNAHPSPKSQPSLLQRFGVQFVALLVAIGGTGGVVAIIDQFQDPEVPPVACTSYWGDIKALGDEGFTGFDLMKKDTELGDRCGEPTKVDEAWSDADETAPGVETSP